jgi:hypothetical protein
MNDDSLSLRLPHDVIGSRDLLYRALFRVGGEAHEQRKPFRNKPWPIGSLERQPGRPDGLRLK